MIIKASELKEKSSEELIQALVYSGVTTAKNLGKMSQVSKASENRIIKELSQRFNLDEEKLLELLNM